MAQWTEEMETRWLGALAEADCTEITFYGGHTPGDDEVKAVVGTNRHGKEFCLTVWLNGKFTEPDADMLAAVQALGAPTP